MFAAHNLKECGKVSLRVKTGLAACCELVDSPSSVFLDSAAQQPPGLLCVIPVGVEGHGKPTQIC